MSKKPTGKARTSDKVFFIDTWSDVEGLCRHSRNHFSVFITSKEQSRNLKPLISVVQERASRQYMIGT